METTTAAEKFSFYNYLIAESGIKMSDCEKNMMSQNKIKSEREIKTTPPIDGWVNESISVKVKLNWQVYKGNKNNDILLAVISYILIKGDCEIKT